MRNDNRVVNVYAVLNDHVGFPWDVLGFGRPSGAGQAYMYACQILAPFCTNQAEKIVLSGRPMLSELERLVKRMNGDCQFAHKILELAKHVDELLYDERRANTSELTLWFVSSIKEFKQFVGKTLTEKWRSGSIELPDKYLTQLVENDRPKYRERSDEDCLGGYP